MAVFILLRIEQKNKSKFAETIVLKNMPNISKKRTVKGYMTFRYGDPLPKSTLLESSYEIYTKEAPLWQKGDESVPVEITFIEKPKKKK